MCVSKLYIFLVGTYSICVTRLSVRPICRPDSSISLTSLLALPPGKAVVEEDQSANEVGTGWVRQVWVVTDGSAPQRARGAAGIHAHGHASSP